jgi:hypothetical protein
MHGARLGECEAGGKPVPLRGGIDRGQRFHIAALAVDGEGNLFNEAL